MTSLATADILLSEDFDELFIEPASRQAQFIPPTALTQDDPNGARRSQRSRAPTDHYAPIAFIGFSATHMELQHHAAMHAANPRGPLDGPNFKLQACMRAAFHAETQPPAAADLSTFSADDFAPAPTHWKHILSLPDHLNAPWIASLRKELLTLLCMETFTPIVTVESDDMIIPMTAKFRIKLTSAGAADKLKGRMCLRGDVQTKGHWYTWCPIASFRALRTFLAIAARQKSRVFQLDFVGTFLQSKAVDRTITTLPKEWSTVFPEQSEWFGMPLLCLKSLHGGQCCNKSWDDHLSSWLSHYGLILLESEGAMFMLRRGEFFLCLLNAVDDQLCFSNCDKMRREFEAAVRADFDVDFLGQAHWCLQARMAQHANFFITLDQSRCAALACSRFVPTLPISDITPDDRERYRQVLPSGFVATKQDLANVMFEVKQHRNPGPGLSNPF
jgi:hypothetical protein